MGKIKQLHLLIIIGLSFLLGNCEASHWTLIRVENATGHDITDVFVSDHYYGNVKKGGKTDYQIYEKAYHYASCTFNIDGVEFRLQPIDFVGEKPLKNGKYGYRLKIRDLNLPQALIELVE
ncbi:MAG: hypothetical protein R2824_21195 [Saprospiraceae bacterium]